MSPYALFRRQGVPQQYAQALQTGVIPAPTRGIVQSENESFMQPGASIVQDNWVSTLRGVKLRGGCIRYCDLHALDVAGASPWVAAHAYTVGNIAFDPQKGTFWNVAIAHTSATAGTFAADRLAHPTYWTANAIVITRLPVISAFEYIHGGTVHRMFAANATKLFEVSAATPVLIKSGQASGNYVAAQHAPATTDWMIAVNEAGDYPLRFNGSTWVTLDGTPPPNWANNTVYAVDARATDTVDASRWKAALAHTSAAAGTFAADRTARPALWVTDTAPDNASWITGPAGTPVVNGHGLSYIWKYRNRLFFIEAGSMNAWYLPLNAVGGLLALIPLSGAASHGGKLMFGATWSVDAGDGLDDKCVFVTDQGEILIFTGSNPADAANWRQEGRWQVAPPLGMNAHFSIGGDLMIMTVEGIVPISQAITKDAGQLELAMITRNIKPMWRDEVNAKRAWAWTAHRWDEYGGAFVTAPGGKAGQRFCFVVNDATGAWCRYLGYDATCFIRQRADMFFGTQDGIVMQADRTGYDDGVPYVAVLVGGWEMFGAPSSEIVWHQARAAFKSAAGEPFQPQLAATVDYNIVVPPPPPAGPDPGIADVWDQGLWGGPPGPPTPPDRDRYAQWDQGALHVVPVRNTMWISIGMTGFAHAPIVQVTVAQQARPNVELIAISTTYERAGINV